MNRVVRRQVPAISAVILAVLLLTAVAAGACPNCQDQLDDTRGRGFLWSIVFMMGAPFGVTAAAVTGIVVSTKRRRRREAAETAEAE